MPTTLDAPTAPATQPRTVHTALAILIGVLSAFAGLSPWLATGMRMPLQNLWATDVLPETMPRVLLPLSNYSVTVSSAMIVIGAALGGAIVWGARALGWAVSARAVLAGVLGVQIIALVHSTWALARGLEDAQRAHVYLGVLACTAALTILIGIPILLGIAHGNPAPVAIAVATAAAALTVWLPGLVFAIAPLSTNVPLAVYKIMEWLPPVVTGVAIGWCGVRTLGRAAASVVALAIIWVGPALATAVSYAIGSRIYLQNPSELWPAGSQVFRSALGSAGQGPQRIAITVVTAILAWLVFSAFARRGGRAAAEVQPSVASSE